MITDPVNELDLAQHPIGVLDSGVGGLSILKEIQRQFPHEQLLFFADQQHVPYGPRPLSQIRLFSEGITRFLLAQGAKLIVVACNTASAAALHHLRTVFPQVPFVGMEPAVKPAAQHTEKGLVGVIATPATFQGELFANLKQRFAQDVTVLEQVCPGLVQQVEKGALDTAETMDLLHQYLDPLSAAGIDTLVLGCTHYPFLTPAIRQVLGPAVQIIDPSPAVARQTGRVLSQRGWLNPSKERGQVTAYTSGNSAAFESLVSRLLDRTGRVKHVHWNGREPSLD